MAALGQAGHVLVGCLHGSRHSGGQRGEQDLLGASAFVWVSLGVFCRRVCAGVTNGIHVVSVPE